MVSEKVNKQELQARMHLAAIVESSDDAIMSKSLDGIVQSWNRAAERIFGYSEKEMLGKTIMLLIPDDHRDEEPQILARIRRGERIDHYETVRKHKDGHLLDVSLTVSPIRNEHGEVVGASKIVRDITLQKEMQQTLQEVQKRLQAVIDAVPIAVFAFDSKGVITLFEGRVLDRIGVNTAALIGKSVFELDAATQSWFSANVQRALAGEERTAIVKIEHHWLEMRLVPVLDQRHGTVLGVSGIALDVTEQRQMQDEIFRTSKLEAIGVLAGGIAHDFNNILTAIVGNLSLARLRFSGDSDMAKCIVESEKAALRARGLTQQLLTFAKGGKPVKKVMALGPLLESSAEFALRGSSTRAELLVANDLYPVEIDEGQINQVMNNLVLNAQQAMPHGGVVDIQARNVRLRTGQLALPPGDYVRIDVVDQGHGIAAEHLPKIFDPFFTTKTQGSGLGLTTVFRILQQHGGHVAAESRLGLGTRFQVFLPRAHGEGIPEKPAEPPLQSGKGRLLFMDDEQSIREFVHELLTMLGYEVVMAEEGAEAVQLYREALARGQPFDIAILDLTVRGGMGGLEALERLRKLDPDILAIVSSGYSNDPVLADHTRFGFAGQVGKPYTTEALTHVLAQVLAMNGGRDSPSMHLKR